jgi:hypothetical protein
MNMATLEAQPMIPTFPTMSGAGGTIVTWVGGLQVAGFFAGSGSDDHLLCVAHAEPYQPLQPAVHARGGISDVRGKTCLFCPGGLLYRRQYLVRSRSRLGLVLAAILETAPEAKDLTVEFIHRAARPPVDVDKIIRRHHAIVATRRARDGEWHASKRAMKESGLWQHWVDAFRAAQDEARRRWPADWPDIVYGKDGRGGASAEFATLRAAEFARVVGERLGIVL